MVVHIRSANIGVTSSGDTVMEMPSVFNLAVFQRSIADTFHPDCVTPF